MKHLKLLFVLGMTLGFLVSCGDDETETEIIQEELTLDEVDQLHYLIEEEKLARDVYTYLYEIHGLFVFNNISGSEQKHMNFVKEILDAYGTENPVIDEAGVFVNQEIQELYNVLTVQGTPTLKEALIVGATIEDLDINDLLEAASATDKEDVIKMYSVLACGSRNHMRGFTGQLDLLGESYEPQFITQEYYKEILTGSHESCGAL